MNNPDAEAKKLPKLRIEKEDEPQDLIYHLARVATHLETLIHLLETLIHYQELDLSDRGIIE